MAIFDAAPLHSTYRVRVQKGAVIEGAAAVDNLDVVARTMAEDTHAVGGFLGWKAEDRALDVVGIEDFHRKAE